MFTCVETKKQNSNSVSFDRTRDKSLSLVHQKFSNMQSENILQSKFAYKSSHNGDR